MGTLAGMAIDGIRTETVWPSRGGFAMTCARPGCAEAPCAWMTYDYAAQTVWLDDGLAEARGHHWALCYRHTSRLRAPVGWSLQDRRSGPRATRAPLAS
ncbi:MAG: DUF3499 family protein [Acidimicrobiales bacterium]